MKKMITFDNLNKLIIDDILIKLIMYQILIEFRVFLTSSQHSSSDDEHTSFIFQEPIFKVFFFYSDYFFRTALLSYTL